MEIEAHIEYGKLKKLAKAMADNISVKVGLLATKAGKNGCKGTDEVTDNLDLAGLGVVQEFGCQIPVTDKMRGYFRHNFKINIKESTTHINIPARSFLQMPLERKGELMKRLKEHGFKQVDALIDHITETGDFESLGIILGNIAVELIQEAFDTSGWGEWEPNSPLTIENKGSAKPLIDKARMRGAITYEVNNNG